MNIRKPILLGLLKMTGSKIPSNLKTIKQLEKNKEKEYQENKLKELLLINKQYKEYFNGN